MKLLSPYLSVSDTAYYLNSNGYNYDIHDSKDYKRLLTTLYDLVIQNSLTIYFYYEGSTIDFHDLNILMTSQYTGDEYYSPIDTSIVDMGIIAKYMTLNKFEAKQVLIDSKVVNVKGQRFNYKHIDDENTTYSELSDDVNITVDDVRISLSQLDSLLDNVPCTSVNKKITRLEAENKQLRQQLAEAQKSQPTNNNERTSKSNIKRNFDEEIIVYLSFLLAQRSNKFIKKNGSINASQIGIAITAIAQDLGLSKDAMHGFKRPDARIRSLINEHKELLIKFEKSETN